MPFFAFLIFGTHQFEMNVLHYRISGNQRYNYFVIFVATKLHSHG